MSTTVTASENVNIRIAKPDDCPEIMRLIIELAMFEKLEDQVKIDAEVLKRDCFGDKPSCHCVVAEPVHGDSKQLIGYALYFPTYSTWVGVCLHLEDIYITPAYRGSGLGKKLWQTVTQIALDMGCSRLQLSVLGWNKHARDLYLRHGCIDMTEAEDWHLMRLRREDMEAFVKT
uniref:N-acetyltransferase domain-containing protein n=2 Tax=Arion vulgaris TaxID=1028688 RepID=A0A0B7ABS6_9EUPU